MKLARSPAHIFLGAALPWIDGILALCLTLLFLGYEGLQYLHHTRWIRFGYCYHDDSYLDVKETTIACAISVTVWQILFTLNGSQLFL